RPPIPARRSSDLCGPWWSARRRDGSERRRAARSPARTRTPPGRSPRPGPNPGSVRSTWRRPGPTPPGTPLRRRRARRRRCRRRSPSFPDRADLDAPPARVRVGGRDLDGVVEVLALDRDHAADEVLGLGERAVGDEDLPAAHPDRRRIGRRPQPLTPQLRPPYLVLPRLVDGVGVQLLHRGRLDLVVAAQPGVLHDPSGLPGPVSGIGAGRPRRPRGFTDTYRNHRSRTEPAGPQGPAGRRR